MSRVCKPVWCYVLDSMLNRVMKGILGFIGYITCSTRSLSANNQSVYILVMNVRLGCDVVYHVNSWMDAF